MLAEHTGMQMQVCTGMQLTLECHTQSANRPQTETLSRSVWIYPLKRGFFLLYIDKRHVDLSQHRSLLKLCFLLTDTPELLISSPSHPTIMHFFCFGFVAFILQEFLLFMSYFFIVFV